MAIQFVFMMCPVGIGVALLRRYARAVPAGAAARDDVPMRLLRWAAGTLWGGSAVDGRRIARLAALSAGLGLYLYGTIAVAVLGAGGPPEDTGWTASYIISDRLGTNVIKLLVVLPLVTATIGWAAAAATARLRPRLAVGMVSVPVTADAPAGEPGRDPMTAPPEAVRAVRVRSWRRIAYLLLLWAVLAAGGGSSRPWSGRAGESTQSTRARPARGGATNVCSMSAVNVSASPSSSTMLSPATVTCKTPATMNTNSTPAGSR